MRTGTVAVLIGALLALRLADLPPIGWCLLLPAGLLAARLDARLRPLALVAVGLLWTLLRAHLALAGALPPALEGVDLTLVGTVSGVPERDGEVLRLDLDVEALEGLEHDWSLPARVRLQAYGEAPAVAPGERWRLRARLKRPRSLSNPGSFDYEAWLLLHRIRATGSLRPGPPPERLATASGQWVDRARAAVAQGVGAALADHPQRGTVEGLVVGLTAGISDHQWRVYRATGTTHIMAISGSHVVLVAGAVLLIVRWLWCRAGSLPLYLPAQRAAAVAGALAAWGYAGLAGFSVPTQRAAVMVSVTLLLQAWRGPPGPSHGLALALLAVLVLDPLSPLSPGFWLSFAAVGILLLTTGGAGRGARAWERWGWSHVLVGVGLLPLTIAFFGESPWLGPAANALAVPWIGLAVVPPALLGSVLLGVSESAAALLLWTAAGAMDLLWPFLEAAAGLGWLYRVSVAPSPLALAAASVGVLLLLLPRGFPARWLGLLWLLPLLLPGAGPRPAPGEAWLTLLDVGQGLAAVVETHAHALLFDAGPRFGSGRDAGESVVAPFLRERGIGVLDRVVLSHGDEDHVGGFRSLAGLVPPRQVLGYDGMEEGPAAEPCRRGQGWVWDGVEFRILHPGPSRSPGDNDGSCVLWVGSRGGALLLTGDIEAAAERALLAADPVALAADVVVAPHHGSRSSSTPGFVRAVAARHALFSTGFRNRFRFPAAAVVQRYRDAGAVIHDTARAGAIHVQLGGAEGLRMSHYRVTHRRFWHTRLEDDATP
jgi:competence protein ComEC